MVCVIACVDIVVSQVFQAPTNIVANMKNANGMALDPILWFRAKNLLRQKKTHDIIDQQRMNHLFFVCQAAQDSLVSG